MWPYELFILSLFIHSWASLIYPISFRTWQVTHFIADTKWIRNSIIWIGRAHLKIFAGTREAWSDKQFRTTGYQKHSRSVAGSDSHRIASRYISVCLIFSGFFSAAIRPVETYILPRFSPHNNGAHVMVIPRLDVSRQASTIFRGTNQWRVRTILRNLEKFDPKTTKTHRVHLRLGCRLRLGRVITRLYDYQTWPTRHWRNSRGAQWFVGIHIWYYTNLPGMSVAWGGLGNFVCAA